MADIGKWFEKKVRESLDALRHKEGLFFHRLLDSHAAGRFVSNAPADFLVAHRGQAQLWECKASEVHRSLRSCLSNMVDDAQVGSHTLWAMAGCESYFIFYSELTNWVEIWNAEDVCYARATGKPLGKTPLMTCALETIDDPLLRLFN